LFLEKSLREMGLSDYEANEFIVYWAPKMLVHNYNVVRFFDDQYTKEARLQVEPKPDSLLRVFMVFKGLTSAPDSNFDGQKFAKFQRKGFALVEWGGDEVK
ncbi:MAG: hypothetical protein NT027_01955, partial [Proteobacteria bacterium]|nr:hypothetical protein [Pseudomonadota bacterium]